MNKNQPKPDPDALVLSVKKTYAIDSLMLGHTITDTAATVDVDRRTVHRWLADDPDFRAELARRRNDLVATVETQLRRLADQAVTGLETAIQAGDLRAILALLKGLGFLTGRPPKRECENAELLEQEYRERMAALADLRMLTQSPPLTDPRPPFQRSDRQGALLSPHANPAKPQQTETSRDIPTAQPTQGPSTAQPAPQRTPQTHHPRRDQAVREEGKNTEASKSAEGGISNPRARCPCYDNGPERVAGA